MSEDKSGKVGLVFSDRYLQHNPGLWTQGVGDNKLPFVDPVLHFSNHRLVMRTKHLIDMTGLSKEMVRIEPYLATEADVMAYHTPEYVAQVKATCDAGGGLVGELAPIAVDGYEIALLAAGGAMAAVDAVMEGRVRRVFASLRPPGHHALADQGKGYCIFGNMAIAVKHAQRKHGVKRAMIVDWDVHFGNGTQAAFNRDPSVLFMSFHQDSLYPPADGRVEMVGEGEGAGYTVCLPLPPGSGDATYLAAFERIILPIGRAFKPELIMVSSGLDASIMDQLGRMCLTTEAYRRMTGLLMQLADECCDGRLAIVQEGGYSEIYAPYCGMAIVEALVGRRSGIEEPIDLPTLSSQPQYSTVGPSGEAALAAIREQQARYWPVLRNK
jgi:acetoin utilization deacetylase AcuC-like enzyme